MQYITELQDAHNDWTYGQLRAEWKKKYHRDISNWKINNILQSASPPFSEKVLREESMARNTLEAIEFRAQYCLRAIRWDRDDLVFIDETGFNKHLRRTRGRSRVGVNAVKPLKTTAGIRLNMCCAVSPRWGVVHYQITEDKWGQRMFASFLTAMQRNPVMQTSKITDEYVARCTDHVCKCYQ